jgi:hypothetical protein
LADIIEDRGQKKKESEKKPHLKDESVSYGINSVLGVVQKRKEGGDSEDYYRER